MNFTELFSSAVTNICASTSTSTAVASISHNTDASKSSNNIPTADLTSSTTAASTFLSTVGEKCNDCLRTFATKKGLNIHSRSCKKLEDLSKEDKILLVNQSQPKQPDINTTSSATKLWGNHSYDDLTQICNAIYEEIVFWRKNLFKLPSGAAGKRYIREKTRLIGMWNENATPLSTIAFKMACCLNAKTL